VIQNFTVLKARRKWHTARHAISHRSFGDEFTLQFFNQLGPSVVDAVKKITKYY
jgi:hypothetical protein